MIEKDYYENPNFWSAERYLESSAELMRYETISLLIPDKTSSILDIGCGNGAFLKYIEDRKKINILLGIERSEAAISNRLCKSEITSGSCDNINFSDSSFDLVIALEVIEHLPKGVYEETLKELQRVASKYLIVSVPYEEKCRHIECNYCGCRFSPYYHLRDFNKAKLVSLFSSFRLIKFKFINSYNNYFIWESLKYLWYYYFKQQLPILPPNSVCPQCGNKGIEVDLRSGQPTKEFSAKHFKSFLKRLTPHRKQHQWIACLYEKV